MKEDRAANSMTLKSAPCVLSVQKGLTMTRYAVLEDGRSLSEISITFSFAAHLWHWDKTTRKFHFIDVFNERLKAEVMLKLKKLIHLFVWFIGQESIMKGFLTNFLLGNKQQKNHKLQPGCTFKSCCLSANKTASTYKNQLTALQQDAHIESLNTSGWEGTPEVSSSVSSSKQSWTRLLRALSGLLW